MQHHVSFALVAFSIVVCDAPLVAQERPFVVASSVETPQPNGRLVARFGVTNNDWHWLQQAFPKQDVVALRTVVAPVRRGERAFDATIVGCTEGLATMAGIRIVRGGFVSEIDCRRSSNVCVVSRSLANRIFRGENPLGKNVRIAESYYTVIGICEPPQVMPASVEGPAVAPRDARSVNRNNVVDLAFIPLAAMRARMGQTHVSRKAGQFKTRRYELSEIWIPGSDASVVKAILRQLRDPNHPHDDYQIGHRRGF